MRLANIYKEKNLKMDKIFTLSVQQIVSFGFVAVVLICLIAFFAKKGLLAFNGKGFEVGIRNEERTIVRRQLEYARASATEIFSSLPRKETWKEWKSLYVKELVLNVIEQAVFLNKISTADTYLAVRKAEVWQSIQSQHMEDEFYRSDEFRKIVFDWLDHLFVFLLKIRNDLEH